MPSATSSTNRTRLSHVTSELVSNGALRLIASSLSSMFSIRIIRNRQTAMSPSFLVPSESALLFLSRIASQCQNALSAIIGTSHEHHIEQSHRGHIGIAEKARVHRSDKALIRETRYWRNESVGNSDGVGPRGLYLPHSLDCLTEGAMKTDGND